MAADLWGHKMAEVIVTLKIMPESVDVDLEAIEHKVKQAVADFGGEVGKVEHKPVAFGLKALMIYFVMDESIGSTEKLENIIAEFHGVNSVEVTDVRRAIG